MIRFSSLYPCTQKQNTHTFLKISLNIETINKTNLSSIVKRMLSAGDDANGPVNGKNVVVKKMILEANLIEKEKSV